MITKTPISVPADWPSLYTNTALQHYTVACQDQWQVSFNVFR